MVVRMERDVMERVETGGREGKESRKKMRGTGCGIRAFLLGLLLSFAVLPGCAAGEAKGADIHSGIQETAEESAQVLVSFLKTREDADCVIISSGGRAVLIDTGEKQDEQKLLAALEELGITAVDYLILTHPDKDHVGGAGAVLESIPVLHVVEPAYHGEEKKEERFRVLNEYCGEKGIPVLCPQQELEVDTGWLDMTVYPPEEAYYEKANNYSLAVLAVHGEVAMFFTGDALRIRSQELLELSLPEIDLYKVPHHGRANKATEELFRAVSPEFAVVTAYVAEEEVAQVCEELGVRLFLTGERNWDFVSDGKILRVREEP